MHKYDIYLKIQFLSQSRYDFFLIQYKKGLQNRKGFTKGR